MCVNSNSRGRGKFKCYGETDPLLLNVKTDNLLDDFESGIHISSRIYCTIWDKSICFELVKHEAPNKFYV